MADTKINWTDKVWNPVTGCTKVSPGCKHCYAERMAKRLQAMGQEHYRDGFTVTLHADALELPLSWKKPSMVFVNSMSDLFHKDVPTEFIHRVFGIMTAASRHTFQVLTKRATRMSWLTDSMFVPDNVWLGVSVENDAYIERISFLRAANARTKFLSIEPLLGPLPNLPMTGIDWVIVGGESGPGARPMDLDWARSIRDQCERAGVAFWFKQAGGHPSKREQTEDIPEDLRIRQFTGVEAT